MTVRTSIILILIGLASCNSAASEKHWQQVATEKRSCQDLVKPISFRGKVTELKKTGGGNRIEDDVILLLESSPNLNTLLNDSCSYFQLHDRQLMLRISHRFCRLDSFMYEDDVLVKDSNSIKIKVYDDEGNYKYAFDFLSD